MPVILSGFLAPTDRLGAIFAAVLIAGIATGSNASQAREQSGPSLRIPESRLAQAAAVMPGVDPSPSGSRASGLRIPPSWLAQANAQRVEEAAERQAVVPSPSGPGRPRSYTIPAMEIVGFDTLLNLINRHIGGAGSSDYSANLTTARNNLHGNWEVDNDPYKVNQIGHPYQGSMYHGFARSAGLSYWEAAAYTFAGSALWEVAGERTPPSMNDQIASGVAGSFFGEALFRMANLVLEQGGGMSPFWREWAATAISPSMGFNRRVMGYNSIFSSRGAPYYSRLSLGFSGATLNNAGSSTKARPGEALADFSFDYGMPGQPGYGYTRAFDQFTFQATASSANLFENVMTRGLLYGRTYEPRGNVRGVWGIYGSYDYIAPQTYRISTTALSIGTTAQAWLTKDIAVQGTALAGMGYAAVSTLHGAGEGDYHYGVTPQALLALRLIFGNKASLDVTGREYFVTGAGGVTPGHDNIVRIDLAFTWRVQGPHAISIRYLGNRRDASYTTLGDRAQIRETVGIFYTFLGHDRFGAVEWR
ncbi:MAG: hypothetical protein A3H32_07275 [Betaproteobacteria bacterium RIFCSPLOWO2_02_FULL_63_19]|nr:MAG: hypothetical protein A3H32_07275 [Betaproteobacteria bacterium RIFCSPLOWO2_02_FULL_63_19]